jgi:hypothetical protein
MAPARELSASDVMLSAHTSSNTNGSSASVVFLRPRCARCATGSGTLAAGGISLAGESTRLRRNGTGGDVAPDAVGAVGAAAAGDIGNGPCADDDNDDAESGATGDAMLCVGGVIDGSGADRGATSASCAIGVAGITRIGTATARHARDKCLYALT